MELLYLPLKTHDGVSQVPEVGQLIVVAAGSYPVLHVTVAVAPTVVADPDSVVVPSDTVGTVPQSENDVYGNILEVLKTD